MFKMYNSDDFESKKVAVTYDKRGEFKEKTEVVVHSNKQNEDNKALKQAHKEPKLCLT